MSATRRARFVAATMFAAALCGCAREPEPGAAHRALRLAADSLVSAGRFERARDTLLALAGGRMRGAAEWERSWASSRAASLAPLCALDPAARAQLVATGWPRPTSVTSQDPANWRALQAALERQLVVRRRLLPADAVDLAETMSALGLIERTKGDGGRAARLQREALRIRATRLGARTPEVGESHLRLGKDLRIAGEPALVVKAEVDSALRIRERCFGEWSHEYAEALADRANFERWRKRRSAALREFERLLVLRRRLDGPRSLAVARVLTDIAVTHLDGNDYAIIEKLTAEAVAIFDAHHAPFDADYTLALNMHGLGLRHVGRLAESARELQRTIVAQEARRREAPDVDVARGRFHRLAAYGDLATVQMLAGDSLAAWETQERGTSRRWLERAVTRGELDSAGAWQGLLARVQARLDDSSAVIGWVDPVYQPGMHGNPSWGYVIRRTGGVRWVRFELAARDPRLSISETCLRIRRQVGWAADWPFRIDRWDDVERSRRDCWEVRFAAFEPLLAGVRDVVVISPQVNFLVPLELMLDSSGRTLDDRFTFRYESSALRFANAPPPERARRVARRWRALLVSAGGEAARVPGRAGLRWADREIAEIAARLDGPLVLEGAAASEARLRRLEADGTLDRMELVHIASHGQTSFAWGSETWLALAEALGDSKGLPPEADGLLELGDLDRWRARARLVTLASCGSGGNAYMHTEGAMGLGQGFVQAGARSVVCSVWPVEDGAARRFMHEFYEALLRPQARPCSIAEALRIARQRLRNHREADGSQPYRHPMYWGGFVLLGDAG